MHPAFTSYILCGTPRSGSTLLCEMLGATGVAGRPNSYFRQQDIAYWADKWGVPHPDGIDTTDFERAYLSAMLREGSAGTGVFGVRIMWGSVADASARLGRVYGHGTDMPAQFERAFGPTLYVHISRLDKVAQAISRLRAEQSGVWHLAADGTVLEGTASAQPVSYDAGRIAELVGELKSDDDAWDRFFSGHRIEPLRLTYETMTADSQAALGRILAALGHDPEIAHGIPVKTAKMGDGESREWAARFRRENGCGS